MQADLMEVLTSKTSYFENLVFTCSTLQFLESVKEEGALEK